MNFTLLVALTSPLWIIALVLLAINHKVFLVRHLNYLKLVLLREEQRYFHGYLLCLLGFLLAWSVPALYTGLFTGLVFLFFKDTYAKVLNPHPVLYFVLLAALFTTFGLSVFVRPVTHSTRQRQLWKHDNLIFFPSDCTTCHVPRPARSRHCRHCGHCVVLYDHHCIWLNNCVGLGNYQWFFSFLAMSIIVLTYGASITGQVLRREWRGVDNLEEVRTEACLTFLLIFFDLMLLWFCYMNYAMVRDGMTTNETSKWGLINDLVNSGDLFQLDGVYFEYLPHEDVFVSINQYDGTVRNVPRQLIQKVQSMEEIVNVYDKGSFWANFKERLYSESLL